MQPDPVGEHTLRIIAKASRFNYWIYKTIYPNLKGKVLEIGSGLGNISQYLIQDGFDTTLSDYNPDYCSYLEQRFDTSANVDAILSINLQEEAFFDKYKDLEEKFDTVYLLNVVEHLADDSKAIAYCHYLLKQNGNLIILVPAFGFLYCGLDKNLGHFRRYTASGLITLLEAGNLRVTHKRYFNALGIFGWLLYGKILGYRMLEQREITAYDKMVFFAKAMDFFFNRLLGLSVIVTSKKK